MLDGDPRVGGCRRKGPDPSERGPVVEECGCRTHPGGGTGWRGRLNRTARLDLRTARLDLRTARLDLVKNSG